MNQAEGVVHDIEKNMEEYKDQLPKEDADKMREDIAKLREKLARKDEETPEAIKEATGEVQKSALKLFEIAYKSKVCVCVCVRVRACMRGSLIVHVYQTARIHDLRMFRFCLTLYDVSVDFCSLLSCR